MGNLLAKKSKPLRKTETKPPFPFLQTRDSYKQETPNSQNNDIYLPPAPNVLPITIFEKNEHRRMPHMPLNFQSF